MTLAIFARRWYPALGLVVTALLLLAALIAAIWATAGQPWHSVACATRKIHTPAYGPWVVIGSIALFLAGSRARSDRHTAAVDPEATTVSRIATVATLTVITGFLGFEATAFALDFRPITWYLRCVEVAAPPQLQVVAAGGFAAVAFLMGHWFAAWPLPPTGHRVDSARGTDSAP